MEYVFRGGQDHAVSQENSAACEVVQCKGSSDVELFGLWGLESNWGRIHVVAVVREPFILTSFVGWAFCFLGFVARIWSCVLYVAFGVVARSLAGSLNEHSQRV
jgi:hypothetical protein